MDDLRNANTSVIAQRTNYCYPVIAFSRPRRKSYASIYVKFAVIFHLVGA